MTIFNKGLKEQKLQGKSNSFFFNEAYNMFFCFVLFFYFRINAIFAHVQAVFEYDSLAAPMKLEILDIVYLPGTTYEASSEGLRLYICI